MLAILMQGFRFEIIFEDGGIRIVVPDDEREKYDEVYETEDYVMYRRWSSRTRLSVPYPEDAVVAVYSTDGELLRSGRTPFRTTLRAGEYFLSLTYRGYAWSGRIRVKGWMENVLFVKRLKRAEGDERAEEKEEYGDHTVVRKPYRYTYFKVVEPRGCRVKFMSEEGEVVHRAEIPTGRRVKAGFYRVEVVCQGGRWKGKVEVKDMMENILYVHRLEERRTPMDEKRFARLLESIAGEPFSEGRLTIIKEAAQDNYFTVEQLIRIINLLPFDSERVAAIKILYHRLVDPQNFFMVYDHLIFESSKREVRKWVERQRGEGE